MRRLRFSLSVLLASLMPLTLFSSCSKEEALEESPAPYTLESNIVINDIWSSESLLARASATRAEENSLKYLIYLFSPDNIALGNSGGDMAAVGTVRNFNTQITSPGTYTLYGLTNVASGEFLSMIVKPMPVILPTSTMTLSTENGPNDVCLGKEELVVTAAQNAYSKTVTVQHIMSRLAFTVKNVPADVNSLGITLPKQANVFDFNGTFSYAKDQNGVDAPVSQTLLLAKAAAANIDGTYNWTCPATIVFPCATGTTSMPVTITWGSATVTNKEVNTTSSVCCLSGKNLSLATTWSEAFRASSSIATANWASVEEGTFLW